jgi:methylmalonyl-CoA mutase N-terminal domain/subunit
MEGLFESLPEGYREKLGRPGEYPFTRGIYPRMYLERPWTMRQYAGFSTAEETNARYRYLLAQGQTGLSVAFDLPTQLGLDPDHPMSVGEVGRVGVSIATLADMEKLFQDIPLDQVSTSMTINAPAMMLLALYLLVAEKQGVPWEKVSGTVQNDILKEYFARGTYIYPPGPSMRLVTDIFEFCSQKVPRWNTISISGYHIREAGATAAQEIAFTLADGKAYVRAALERGLDIDRFAPRLSFFFAAHNDIFEEAAKFRAARRLWARIMREEFGAKDPKSWMLRFHTQTGGSTLTAQEPLNNVVRTAYQALAAVLGGTQSLHTNAYDEALGLPTEKSALLALRTQQILAYESGVTRAVDPLGRELLRGAPHRGPGTGGGEAHRGDRGPGGRGGRRGGGLLPPGHRGVRLAVPEGGGGGQEDHRGGQPLPGPKEPPQRARPRPAHRPRAPREAQAGSGRV